MLKTFVLFGGKYEKENFNNSALTAIPGELYGGAGAGGVKE